MPLSPRHHIGGDCCNRKLSTSADATDDRYFWFRDSVSDFGAGRKWWTRKFSRSLLDDNFNLSLTLTLRSRRILGDELGWCTSNSFYGTLDGNFIWSRQLFRIRSVRLILLSNTQPLRPELLTSFSKSQNLSPGRAVRKTSSVCLFESKWIPFVFFDDATSKSFSFCGKTIFRLSVSSYLSQSSDWFSHIPLSAHSPQLWFMRNQEASLVNLLRSNVSIYDAANFLLAVNLFCANSPKEQSEGYQSWRLHCRLRRSRFHSKCVSKNCAMLPAIESSGFAANWQMRGFKIGSIKT